MKCQNCGKRFGIWVGFEDPDEPGLCLTCQPAFGKLRAELAEQERVIAQLRETLEDVLDMVGDCDRSEEARGRCMHHGGSIVRLPCPVDAAQAALDAAGNRGKEKP